MNINDALRPLERLLLALQIDVNRPKPWGIFHIIALCITFAIIGYLYTRRNHHSEAQLKCVLGVYSIVTLILEIGKQFIWSFHYDSVSNLVTWDYPWYAAPFQFCTTPMYVCLLCLFLRKCKLRNALLSYVAYITILGSIAVMIIPTDCFCSDLLVNVHTTYLHFGSCVVSVYLLMSREVRTHRKALLTAIGTFLVFVGMAMAMNLIVYHADVLNGETFNMFYISPYFTSSLPVFSTIQPMVPYPVFFMMYIATLTLGGVVVYNIAKMIKYLSLRHKYHGQLSHHPYSFKQS